MKIHDCSTLLTAQVGLWMSYRWNKLQIHVKEASSGEFWQGICYFHHQDVYLLDKTPHQLVQIELDSVEIDRLDSVPGFEEQHLQSTACVIFWLNLLPKCIVDKERCLTVISCLFLILLYLLTNSMRNIGHKGETEKICKQNDQLYSHVDRPLTFFHVNHQMK